MSPTGRGVSSSQTGRPVQSFPNKEGATLCTQSRKAIRSKEHASTQRSIESLAHLERTVQNAKINLYCTEKNEPGEAVSG
jgi:hypothetical protein